MTTSNTALAYSILAISTTSLLISGLSLAINIVDKQSRSIEIAQSANNIKRLIIKNSDSESVSEVEELAINRRVANIISYSGLGNFSIEQRSPYIKALASQIRKDTIDKLAYENLRSYGVMNPDLIQTGDDTYTFRDKWNLVIKPGSHFYNNPITSVMFINETFPIPQCVAENGFEPYVAFMATDTSMDIKISTEFQTNQPSYRITAFDKNGTQILSNIEERVIIDAGCWSREDSGEDGDYEEELS